VVEFRSAMAMASVWISASWPMLSVDMGMSASEGDSASETMGSDSALVLFVTCAAPLCSMSMASPLTWGSGRGSTPLVGFVFLRLSVFFGGGSWTAPLASAASWWAGMPLSRVKRLPLRAEYGRPWSVPNLYRGSVCGRQYCSLQRMYATYIASLGL